MINMYIHCVVPCVITQDINHTYVHPLLWFHKYVFISNTCTSQRLFYYNLLCSMYCHTVNSNNSLCDIEILEII